MNKLSNNSTNKTTDIITKKISKSIIVAGGCFWGLQKYYSMVKGVVGTAVGYAGGNKKFPSYEEVCSQITGHTEAVYIEYDPELTSIKKLLDHYFFIVDPTSLNFQAHDYGTQYRSALFYNDDEEKKLLKNYIDSIQKNYESPIVVELLPSSDFWPAEDYHQDYLYKNPYGYCHITHKHFRKIKDIDDMI